MTNAQQTYASWLQELPYVPFFHQAGWWQALWGDDWSVALYQKGDHIQGALPYRRTQKFGLSLIRPPMLTPYHGPLLLYPPQQKRTTRYSFQQEVVQGLLEQLPAYQHCYFHLRPQSHLGMAFHLAGFNLTTRYTYVVPELSNAEDLFGQCRENIRREIRKAEKKLTVSPEKDIELLHQVKKAHYAAQKGQYQIPKALLERGFTYSIEQKQGELLVARDEQGRPQGTLWYVWDDESAYYLHGGTFPQAKNSGAMSLLLWTALKQAAHHTQSFNFEGSMVHAIERYFRNFGGERTPYLAVSRTPNLLIRWWRNR